MFQKDIYVSEKTMLLLEKNGIIDGQVIKDFNLKNLTHWQFSDFITLPEQAYRDSIFQRVHFLENVCWVPYCYQIGVSLTS